MFSLEVETSIGEIRTKPGTSVKPGRAIIFKTALNFRRHCSDILSR